MIKIDGNAGHGCIEIIKDRFPGKEIVEVGFVQGRNELQDYAMTVLNRGETVIYPGENIAELCGQDPCLDTVIAVRTEKPRSEV